MLVVVQISGKPFCTAVVLGSGKPGLNERQVYYRRAEQSEIKQ